MISISAFVVSLLGIISLLSFRMWETRKGKILFSVERKIFDDKIISFEKYLSKRVSVLDKTIVLRTYHSAVHYFALIMLGAIKMIEKKMVYLLEHIRGKREVSRGVTKSEFLKQVGDHKQNLEKPKSNSVK